MSPERERALRFAAWAAGTLDDVRDRAREELSRDHLVFNLDEVAALQSIANRANEAMRWASKLQDSLTEETDR